jgi:hypothetical protein
MNPHQEEIDHYYNLLTIDLEKIERGGREKIEKKKNILIQKFEKEMDRMQKAWDKIDKIEARKKIQTKPILSQT